MTGFEGAPHSLVIKTQSPGPKPLAPDLVPQATRVTTHVHPSPVKPLLGTLAFCMNQNAEEICIAKGPTIRVSCFLHWYE